MLLFLYFSYIKITFVLLLNCSHESINTVLDWMIVEYVLDVYWWIDIYLRYKYVSQFIDGAYLDSHEAIKSHYRRFDGLYLDLIAAFPYDIFALASSSSSNYAIMFAVTILRFPRLIFLRRYFTYFGNLVCYLIILMLI